jgi:hypothetical protein
VLCQAEAVGEQLALLEAEITPIRRALGEAGEPVAITVAIRDVNKTSLRLVEGSDHTH